MRQSSSSDSSSITDGKLHCLDDHDDDDYVDHDVGHFKEEDDDVNAHHCPLMSTLLSESMIQQQYIKPTIN